MRQCSPQGLSGERCRERLCLGWAVCVDLSVGIHSVATGASRAVPRPAHTRFMSRAWGQSRGAGSQDCSGLPGPLYTTFSMPSTTCEYSRNEEKWVHSKRLFPRT